MAWVAVPSLALLEACPGVGFFISGIILLSICTFLYAEDLITLSTMLPLAFAGACIGDHLGFYAGRWLGPRIRETKFATKRLNKIEKAEAFIRKYGSYSILLGRLLTSVRSVVPILIGASGLGRLKFTISDILACAIWTWGLAMLVVGIENFL
ncbi:MAG: hypothetical protein CBC09_01420 [Cellvibrionales bacterium TMED49]|nr:hypothetical protein [Porticoccaceae bacterium]OUU39779.1 MAG: hypothetical protein CBC09_01420 [Cellvibrionales bacterium TMED49]